MLTITVTLLTVLITQILVTCWSLMKLVTSILFEEMEKNANLTVGIMVPSSNFYHRVTLSYDGVLVQYAHLKASANETWDQSWFPVWAVLDNICTDIIGRLGSGACGFNSYCVLGPNRRPTYECPPGYSFFDADNKFGGCKLYRVPKCEEGGPELEDIYDMHMLSNTFWPISDYEQ